MMRFLTRVSIDKDLGDVSWSVEKKAERAQP